MKRPCRATLFVIVLLPLLPACGSSSITDPPGTGLINLASCTADTIEDWVAIMEALMEHLDMFPPGDVDIDLPGGGNITGELTTVAGDLSDGFHVGDIGRVVWTATLGDIDGNGDITVDFQTATAQVATGEIHMTDGTCFGDFTNLNLSFDRTVEDGYPTGSVDFMTSVPPDELSGTISADGSSEASVDAELNGVDVSFDIDLDAFDVLLFG